MIIQMVHNEKAPLNRHNQYTIPLNHHLRSCQWRVFAEILAASYLKNWQEEKERLGDKLTFMPCKSSTQGWGLKSKVTLSSGWEYQHGLPCLCSVLLQLFLAPCEDLLSKLFAKDFLTKSWQILQSFKKSGCSLVLFTQIWGSRIFLRFNAPGRQTKTKWRNCETE